MTQQEGPEQCESGHQPTRSRHMNQAAHLSPHRRRPSFSVNFSGTLLSVRVPHSLLIGNDTVGPLKRLTVLGYFSSSLNSAPRSPVDTSPVSMASKSPADILAQTATSRRLPHEQTPQH